jgi:hypothetical protein
VGVATGAPAVPAPVGSSASAHRMVSRGSSPSIAVPASPVSAVGQARRPMLAGPYRRDASDARTGAPDRERRAAHALEGFGRRAVAPVVSWSDPVAGLSASRSAVGSVRGADSRPARSAGSSGGGGGLDVPSPFGPPGRGVVAGAGGVSSAAAGSGVVAAILIAGLLLLYFQPLRRFRLSPVMAGPVGFFSLQQRPG